MLRSKPLFVRLSLGWNFTLSSNSIEAAVQERPEGNGRARELKERIRSIKAWRKELERSVGWQREERGADPGMGDDKDPSRMDYKRSVDEGISG